MDHRRESQPDRRSRLRPAIRTQGFSLAQAAGKWTIEMDQNTAGRTETASEYSADALGIDGGLVYNAIHWSTISR